MVCSGDSREVVREKANIALCKLMDATVAPQLLFEKMTAAFTHKNGKVNQTLSFLFGAVSFLLAMIYIAFKILANY